MIAVRCGFISLFHAWTAQGICRFPEAQAAVTETQDFALSDALDVLSDAELDIFDLAMMKHLLING